MLTNISFNLASQDEENQVNDETSTYNESTDQTDS
jgi:hypothetical protein